jgi:hypothetical protein
VISSLSKCAGLLLFIWIVESVEAASGSMKRTQNQIFPAGLSPFSFSAGPGSFNVMLLKVIVLLVSSIATV